MKVAVVGATGLVGQTMLRVLEKHQFPVTELILVASERSVGKEVEFQGQAVTVCSLEQALGLSPDLALFSAGSGCSLEWAEKFAAKGCYVVDNSSAWRMHPEKKLIVPEVNGNVLNKEDRVIANPNCSTIQLVTVLKPIADHYGLKRVVVSTYQSVTGSGQKGINQLLRERGQVVDESENAYPYAIDRNVLPHIDVFQENGYTKEEMKLVLESQKILDLPQLQVTPTAVRVPVVGGHSESVSIETERAFELQEVFELLKKTPGIVVQDEPEKNIYPLPILAEGKDEVFVGRIRKDLFHPKVLNCWIVADNLRKGAATNTVQIAEYLLEKGWLPA